MYFSTEGVIYIGKLKLYSQTYIAKTLHVSRKTIRKIIKSEERGEKELEKKPHPSVLDEYREFIEIQINKGLSKQRIYQDLVKEYQFNGSYSTVRDYVNKITTSDKKVYMVIRSLPGEEAQVDFGYIGYGDTLDVSSSLLQNYTMTVSGQTLTATLNSGKENVTLADNQSFYSLLKSMVTVTAGYTYNGVSIGVNDANYSTLTNNDIQIVSNLKSKLNTSEGINAITLGELKAGHITVKLQMSKGSQVETYTVIFA